MALGVMDDFVEFIQFDRFSRLVHIHPAALAAEVAGVEDGDV